MPVPDDCAGYPARIAVERLPGGILPPGPDRKAFEAASNAPLQPHMLEGAMAFLFDRRSPQRVTRDAADLPERQ